VIGPDAGDGYTQHYFDSRGIARLYAMTFERPELDSRAPQPGLLAAPVPPALARGAQRRRQTIDGRWETSPGGRDWELDFELAYRRLR
jgi:hypothetical protein